MPMPVLQAARHRGRRDRRDRRRGPDRRPEALADAGIDLEDVTDQLLREGIDAFMVPMQKLLDGIEAKRAEIAGAGIEALGQLEVVRGQELLVGEHLERRPVGDDPARGEQHRALAQRARRAAGRG